MKWLFLAFGVVITLLLGSNGYYVSRDGFSVNYPSNWLLYNEHAAPPGLDRLDIISRSPIVHGAIIESGQAEIIVERFSNERWNSIVRTIQYRHSRGASIGHRVLDTMERGINECEHLAEFIVEDPGAANSSEIDHFFTCDIGALRFLTTVRYFRNDPSARDYRVVALQVIRSIRLAPPSPTA